MSMSRSMSFRTPMSGTLKSALSKLRDQFSRSDCRTLYIKVALVPFQTPHADSLFHSWAITSRTESGVRMQRWWPGAGLLGIRGDWRGVDWCRDLCCTDERE